MADPAREKQVVDAVPTDLFIGGDWRPATTGKALPVEDPSTSDVLAEVADGNASDALAALEAAAAAQQAWATTPPKDRGEILRKTYEQLNRRADELALLMTLELG